MMDFYEDLADLNLNGKIYGVVGSGDTSTTNSVKLLMTLIAFFVATGAEKGSECVKVDLSAEEEDIERFGTIRRRIGCKSRIRIKLH